MWEILLNKDTLSVLTCSISLFSYDKDVKYTKIKLKVEVVMKELKEDFLVSTLLTHPAK